MTDQDRDTLTRLVAELRRRAKASLGPYGPATAPYINGRAEGFATAAGMIELVFAGTDALLVTAETQRHEEDLAC